MSEDDLLDVNAAAELLHFSPQTLRNMRNKGIGPLSFKVGKRLLYRRSDIDAYIAEAREKTLRGGSAE